MRSPPSNRTTTRGQSSPVGVILLLGMVIAAASSIVVFGGIALENTQSSSEIGQAEQALTQFDARTAQVALGDSESQTVQLGGSSGSYRVEEDVGRVRLLHEDWNGTDCGNCDSDYGGFDNTTNAGNTTILYNETLGAVVYESGDTELGYQGGGVWRKPPEGESRPVSSPEFHYRSATLTFPLVRVEGSGSAGGSASARVTRVETAEDIYANSSDTYPDSETKLLNPVQQGNMSVEITSEYCEGWRTYFQKRTEGQVSDCNDGTVVADIVALGTQGDFSIINGEELSVRGQDGLDTFEVTLEDEDDQNSKFNNLGWSMSAQNGSREIELSVQGGGNVDVGDPATVIIYYSYDGTVYDAWVNDQDFIVEDNGDGPEVTVDFMSSKNASWSSLSGSSDLEEHDPDTQNASRPSALSNSEENMSDIVQHYFDLIGDVDFNMNEKNEAGLADASSGNIEYEGEGNVVTYLHVTENRVEVEVSG